MKLPHIVLAAAVVVCALASLSPAATYYVDASGGDDSRDGLSPALAWKTIAKVNGSFFFPGDQILFKRGEVWRESLVPPSSGSSENPIRFDASRSGDAPTITGYQALPAKTWIEIQHLKLSYYDSYGLRIGGASDHITIANVYADGVIPAGALPHGFFVNSTSNPSDINFYNVDAHRNYDGFRFMGAAGAIT